MKPRVLQFICPTGYYGAERWIIALLNSMNHDEVESHLCITLEGNSSSEIIDHCDHTNVKVHLLPMQSKFDVSVIGKLVDTIKDNQIDIIHTHGYKSDILGVIAGRKAGIKTICTPHGFENASDFKLKAYMWAGGKSFHFFDIVCPLSPQIEKDLLDIYNVKPSKIKLINNGVDIKEVTDALSDSGAIQPKDENSFVIGYVGQLISRKNMASMLRAFKLFYSTTPNARLVILGDGDEKPMLMKLAEQLGIQNATSFLGFRDDRLAFLPTFDTFSLTSSLEGIPRCLMEAMAAKVCISAYNIPGVDQLIKHEETGLAVPFNDEQALADSWATLAANPELKKTWADSGNKFVLDNFSSDAMARTYTALYEKLLQLRKGQYA